MFKEQPRKPRFKGKFYTFSVRNSNTPSEELLERRLLVFSSGKRDTVLRYLYMKFLWDSLTEREQYLLWHLPEFFKDNKFLAIFRLSKEGIPLKIIRKRVQRVEELLGERVSTRELYLGYKSYRLEIHEISKRLRPAIKFTGYVKSIAAIGKQTRRLSFTEPIPQNGVFTTIEEFDWYVVLSVGEFPLFQGSGSIILKSP
jgi:hypothetical protein